MALIPIEKLPLGFRFHPTDQELINHYLKRKINGSINSDAFAVIPEVDVCRCEPWDLRYKSVIKSEDREWFFFAPRDRKYANGARHNRATEAGYWKATGIDRSIKSRGGGAAMATVIGKKKTLVFHRGRAPRGERTNFIMHEYRTVEPEFKSGEQGQFVLCRLFEKPGENNLSTNADEVERSGFSPAPTRSSPIDTQGDTSEEFGTQLEQRPPKSELQENSQALPVSSDNRLVSYHRQVNDAADFSAASDVSDHVVAEDVQPQFTGEHCSNVGSPLLALGEDFQFHDYFDRGSSMELLQDTGAELDSFVDSLLSNQVEDVSEMFDIQNDFTDGSVPSYQVCPTTTEPPLDPKLCQFSGTSSMVATEPVLAQAQSLTYGSGFINPLANEFNYANEEFNYSVSPEMSVQFNLLSKAAPWERTGPTVFREQLQSSRTDLIMHFQSSTSVSSLGKRPPCEQYYIMNNFAGDGSVQNPTSTLDDSTTRVSRTAKGIRIRHRQPHLSSNITGREQGLATRRIRLQRGMSEVPAVDAISGSNKNGGVVKAATKDGEYLEHHIAEEREVSGPNLDELEDFSDHRDNSTSTDIAATPADPSVRLRKKLTDDTGNELESKFMHPLRPKQGPVSVLGIILPLLFILLLSVGSWYYFNL